MALDLEGSGSDQWRSYTGAPLTAPPLTLACWVKAESHAAVGAIFGLWDADGSNPTTPEGWSLQWTTTPTVAARSESAGFGSQSVSGTASDGVWCHAAGTFSSATNRLAYLNGVAGSVQSTSRVVDEISHVVVGRTEYVTTSDDYFDGAVAHVAVWNVVLSAQEVLSLANGAHPYQVRRDALVFYDPLTGQARDLVAQLTGTDNGAVAYVDGPRPLAGGPR